MTVKKTGLAAHPLAALGEDALLGAKPQAVAAAPAPKELDIDLVERNPEQPRRDFDAGALEDLADSIRAHGIIQPIVVRPFDGKYQIIAGERRWRAAQLAGLLKVPVVIRDVPGGDQNVLLQLALIENIQRENLNPIDEAIAYQRLTREFHLTHDQIAQSVGRARPTITTTIRLLELPEDVRSEVAAGSLSRGHAVALLGLDNKALIQKLAKQIVQNKFSVRHVEQMVAALRDAEDEKEIEKKAPKPEKLDANTQAALQDMKMALGVSVQIKRKGAGGHLRIDFASEEQLIRIYERITGK